MPELQIYCVLSETYFSFTSFLFDHTVSGSITFSPYVQLDQNEHNACNTGVVGQAAGLPVATVTIGCEIGY